MRAKLERWSGIAKRRKRSAAKRAAGSHSALIVPQKPGNSHRRGPGGGKRGVELWSGGELYLEVDIRKFFDTLDHAHLRRFLQQRIRDGVVLRLIGKWLNAGVMEDGAVTHPETGGKARRAEWYHPY